MLCRRLLPLLLLLLVLSHAPAAHAQPSDAQVGLSIQRLQRFLFDVQDAQTGGWHVEQYEQGRQVGGVTALVVTALLASGISAQHPDLARAIDYLDNVDMVGTYPVALRTHVWSQLPRDYHGRLVRDAQWLLRAASDESTYTYAPFQRGLNRADHSNTHYGMLGMWEAAKRGFSVRRDFWLHAQDYFLDAQNRDGGWGYAVGPPAEVSASTGSMTAAGLTVLLIVQQQAHRDRTMPHEPLAAGIERGLDWLDARFTGHVNHGVNGWTYYYLYAIERVALASGIKMLNRRDWYELGAEYILRDQEDNGSIDHSVVRSAFALMFLSRGRVPVWATKLSVPGQPWNNRPNDLCFLTDYLSDFREGELNWQALSINMPVELWHDTPLLYLATDRRLVLEEDQMQRIKDYLDAGGTLLVNPDNGSAATQRMIRDWARRWYPDNPMRELPDDHPIFDALEPIPPNLRYRVFAVGNGVRDMIVMADRDWGFQWQSATTPGHTPPWKLAVNLWALVTDRGLLRPRLEHRFPTRASRMASGKITVARLRHDGNWLPEPAAWRVFAPVLLERTGIEATTRDIDIVELRDEAAPLAHLTGIDARRLTDDEIEAIDRYTWLGGTVLIETAGGQGDFARAIETQLAAHFNAAAVPIADEHPIVTGGNLDGGIDCSHVRYRRFAVARLLPGGENRLRAFHIDNRPTIIIANEDLTQGMMRVDQWGVVGYDSDSAQGLITNLAAWAAYNSQHVGIEPAGANP
jgi:hypothetical protein